MLFKEGALSVLTGQVKIGKAYDTIQWRTEAANLNMSGAIAALGAGNIQGVYAANDSLAAGSISAMKSNKMDPLPPVTGQDAELAAVRRIVRGDQYMTVYKPFPPEAAAGAAMAVAAAREENLDRVAKDKVRTSEGQAVPAVMLTPVSRDRRQHKDVLVKGGVYTVRQICVPISSPPAKGRADLTSARSRPGHGKEMVFRACSPAGPARRVQALRRRRGPHGHRAGDPRRPGRRAAR